MADLMTALRNADAAGDTEAATRIAGMIKAQQGQPQDQARDQAFGEVSSPELVKSVPVEEASFSDQLIGGLENLGSLASSAIAEPIAGLAGIASEVFTGKGGDTVDDVRESLTYQPRTDAAKAQMKSLGDKVRKADKFVSNAIGVDSVAESLSDLDKTLGKTVLDMTGSATLATAAHTLPTALLTAIGIKHVGSSAVKALKASKISAKQKRAILAESIKAGVPNVKNVAKELNKSGDIITNPVQKKAAKILDTSGNGDATAVVLSNMHGSTKVRVNKMLDIIERGEVEPLYKQSNRPSDVLGDSLANRARSIANINKKAGKEIKAAAEDLKGINLDVTDVRDAFVKDLQDVGVVVENLDGRIKLDFSDSTFVGGGADKMERMINAIGDGQIDAFKGHKQKRFVRELVSFGKGTESAISAESQKILKSLASGIDKKLDNISPKYDKANKDFAKTIDAVEKLNKLVGKDVDLFSDLSGKALATKARRLTSEAPSRVTIEQTLRETDEILKGFGERVVDDVPSLVFTVNALEELFKITPPTSLGGVLAKTGGDIALGGLSGATSATIAGVRGLSNAKKALKPKEFSEKMKALRMLTKGKGK